MSSSLALFLSATLVAIEPASSAQAPSGPTQMLPHAQNVILPHAAMQQTVQQAVQAGGHSSAKGRSGSARLIPVAKIKVELFTTKDGKSGWKARIPGGRALATPAVVGGMVYIGGGFGSREFYAFHADTGKPAWALALSDDGPTAAVVAEGRVVFNTESCTLFVVDARTGKQLWSRWLGDPLLSQPAVHAGVVYMAYPGGGGHRLIALGLGDGKKKWEVPIAGDIISAPVVDGDSVYLATFDGTVYRHDLVTGSLMWKKEMQATSAPWIENGELHVAQRVANGTRTPEEGLRTITKAGVSKGGLKARKSAPYLDPRIQDGSRYAAKQSADDASVGFGGGAPSTAKAPAAKANTGIGSVRGLWEFQGSRPMKLGKKSFASQGDVLRGIDADSGAVLWEKKLDGDVGKLGGHLASPPSFANGKLVVGTTAGSIVAFDADKGSEIFRYEAREEIRFQPALVRGRVFVGTATGTLISIVTGDASLDGWTMWGGGPEHNGPRRLPVVATKTAAATAGSVTR
jgi:Ca-activated chloride channel family protein